jgi:hypothetical protein
VQALCGTAHHGKPVCTAAAAAALYEAFEENHPTMNHKRKRPKNRRSGCLLCKCHKVNGFSWARRYPKLAAYARQDVREPVQD